jgi:hypothetical protein
MDEWFDVYPVIVIKHHVIVAYGRPVVEPHAFLTSALTGCISVMSRPL